MIAGLSRGVYGTEKFDFALNLRISCQTLEDDGSLGECITKEETVVVMSISCDHWSRRLLKSFLALVISFEAI
jgi:hypothetical protein